MYLNLIILSGKAQITQCKQIILFEYVCYYSGGKNNTDMSVHLQMDSYYCRGPQDENVHSEVNNSDYLFIMAPGIY